MLFYQQITTKDLLPPRLPTHPPPSKKLKQVLVVPEEMKNDCDT